MAKIKDFHFERPLGKEASQSCIHVISILKRSTDTLYTRCTSCLSFPTRQQLSYSLPVRCPTLFQRCYFIAVYCHAVRPSLPTLRSTVSHKSILSTPPSNLAFLRTAQPGIH
ncbi:hypothetical protein UPYG_G00197890 [Umbra pygmaea]|uniref:Uncharacterized protein n=1 Tax=Umbra pygmaea TaxID=75934 RepID=A0ABD0WIG7_UMBPY